MAKLLKHKISKAVSSSFNSCRSKDPCTLPQHSVPSFLPNTQLITVDHLLSEEMIHRNNGSQLISTHDDLLSLHVSATPVTAHGRCSSRNGEAYTSHDSRTRSPSHEFKWKKEEDKWQHVIKTTYNDDTKQQFRTKISYSSISIDSDNDDENEINFTSEKANWDYYDDINITNEDEEDETETLVSSSSSCKSYVEFSNDSSSNISQNLEAIDETTPTRRPKKIATIKRRVEDTRGIINKNGRRSSISTSSGSELPPRLSVLIPSNVEGKVKESFAILKKSEDPYEDFKSSMMEMILEKKMFDKNDLEQLLHCFLSLNAKNYHGVIIEAFSEIWKTLFSPNHN